MVHNKRWRFVAARLAELGIPYTFHEHEPVGSVAQGRLVRDMLDGLVCKCLLLKSADGRYWLIAMDSERQLNLKLLAKALGSSRLSFAAAPELYELLQLTPGSVSPLAVPFDESRRITVVVEESLLKMDRRMFFHPLVNTASVGLQAKDLLRFLENCGHPPLVVSDVSKVAESAAAAPEPGI